MGNDQTSNDYPREQLGERLAALKQAFGVALVLYRGARGLSDPLLDHAEKDSPEHLLKRAIALDQIMGAVRSKAIQGLRPEPAGICRLGPSGRLSDPDPVEVLRLFCFRIHECVYAALTTATILQLAKPKAGAPARVRAWAAAFTRAIESDQHLPRAADWTAHALWGDVRVVLLQFDQRCRQIMEPAKPTIVEGEASGVGQSAARERVEARGGLDGAEPAASPGLTSEEQELLQAAEQLKAVDEANRRTREQLVHEVSPGLNPENYRKKLRGLVVKGRLRSRTGKRGGYWLVLSEKVHTV
jgi:hypothetical protein